MMASKHLTARLLALPTSLRTLTFSHHILHAAKPLTLALQPRASLTTTSSTTNPASSPSADSNTLSHFAALASTWWDPHGPSRLLHLMNPLRHTFIRSCLASTSTPHDTPTRYLDVGCGGGIFAESAARLRGTAAVTGVDPSPEVVAVARAHARRDPSLLAQNRLSYLNCGVEELETREAYDVVSLFEVLEHVEKPGDFLEAVGAQVKPGGWLVLSTIARTWTSWVTTKVMAEGVLRIVPWGTHEWDKYINEDELRGWFERRGGWESPRAMGVVYVPGLGWKEARGGEEWGNYFFGVRKSPA